MPGKEVHIHNYDPDAVVINDRRNKTVTVVRPGEKTIVIHHVREGTRITVKNPKK